MATAVTARRFLSPALAAVLSRRTGALAGLGLALAGIVLLTALASYNPHDPSLDTASAASTRNLVGPVGATMADLLLQGFGFAGALPGIALLAWGWRVARRRKLHVAMRLICLLLALPLAGGLLGLVTGIAQPTLAGPGGAAGLLIAPGLVHSAATLFGPLGRYVVGFALFLLALSFTAGAFGLSLAEWLTAGRFTFRVIGVVRRVPAGIAWLFRPVIRSGARPEEPLRPPAATALRRGKIPPRPVVPPTLRPMTEDDDDPASALVAELPPPDKPRSPLARLTARPEPKPAPPKQQALPLEEPGWKFPSLSLLKPAPRHADFGPSEDALQANARLLETVLNDYGVQGAIREIRPGPVVTLYELEPAPGIRSARVIGLADDIARSLSVAAVRIATVPGRNVIGIEVPNAHRETVFLSELLETDHYGNSAARLTLALGKDISGAPVVVDLARMPHLLIAGTTGSGKSVGVNAMILSLLYRLSPDQCRLIMIDPKMLELSTYEGIPHLMAPVVTDPKKAVTALKWSVREMERRYRNMAQLGVRNIGGYNERVADARAKGEVISRRVQTGFDAETGRPIHEEVPLALEHLPFLVVVIDEMADLMMVAGKEIEVAVQRLAQMARAAGIHVIMATQRPSVDVITGTIKANFPTRISFQVISKFDSRTILGEQGAEQLLGQGDLLYMMGGGRITRVHGPFVSDGEVEAVAEYLRQQGAPAYLDDVTEADDDDSGGGGGGGFSPMSAGGSEKGLYEQAVDLVAREGKASTSFVQRHLQIGYNRAAKLIEQMEKDGIVGAANHVGKREVLVRHEED
jgi:DNA segregation ATPase FtsK/SpoIIIE, S-DNA-T family